MEAHKKFLENFEYKKVPIDMESVIKNQWVTIDYFDRDELDWLCVQIKGKWHIFCRKNMCNERKRFTLAHEFKHFLEKENACAIKWHMRTKIERDANTFAWKLLVPSKALAFTREKYKNFETLKKIFWVSIPVIKKRLEDEWINY